MVVTGSKLGSIFVTDFSTVSTEIFLEELGGSPIEVVTSNSKFVFTVTAGKRISVWTIRWEKTTPKRKKHGFQVAHES